MYVDAGHGRSSGTPCCTASGTASAGSTTSAWARPSGSWRSTWRASRCSSPATRTARCTRPTTSAGTAARSSAHREQPARDAALAALPLPLLDLRPRRAAAEGAARDGRRPGGVRAAPGRRRDLAGVRLRAPDARRRAAACSSRWGTPHARWPTTARRPGDRAGAALRRRGQLQGAARELQRVLPLRPGAPRAVPAGAVVRRWRRRPRLGRGHPAPRGRVDVHHDRHHRPRAAGRARRGRADPAQGRPRLPQPDAVVLGRPCRRLRAAPAGGGPHRGGLLAALRAPRRSPTRRSTRATPPSSGTWSTSRTGRSASRCSAACRRGPTGTAGSRRWRTTASTSGAGCCPRLERRDDRGFDYVVIGLGGLGSATAWELAQRGHRVLGLERFALGHSRGASHDTSRILRHSYHTPAYVRLTQEAYADWARLEQESGAAAGDPHRRARPVPARPGDPRDRLHPVDGRRRRRLRGARRRPAMARWPQLRVPRDRGAVPGRRRDRARRAAPRRCCTSRRGGSVPSCATTRPSRARGPRRRRRAGHHPAGEVAAAASWSPPTRGPMTWSATSGCRSRSR